MVGGTHWCLWNLSAPGVRLLAAEDVGEVQHDGALEFRWARHDPNMFVTTGRQGTLRFHHLRYPHVPQTHHVAGPTGAVAWHASQPLCAIASDRAVHFWLVPM